MKGYQKAKTKSSKLVKHLHQLPQFTSTYWPAQENRTKKTSLPRSRPQKVYKLQFNFIQVNFESELREQKIVNMKQKAITLFQVYYTNETPKHKDRYDMDLQILHTFHGN